MRWPRRYSIVPWLGPPDLEPLGIPEDSKKSEDGKTIAHILRIPTPFGPGTDALLQVNADRHSKVIAMAIVTAIGESLPVDLREIQSNPRRVLDDDGA